MNIKSLTSYLFENCTSIKYNFINEKAFSNEDFVKHNHKYVNLVLNDILNDVNIKMTDGTELNPEDFDLDKIKNLKSNLNNYNSTEAINIFNNSYIGSFNKNNRKKIWTNIEKGVYSGAVRKTGGGIKFEQGLCNNLIQLVLTDTLDKSEKYYDASINLWNNIKDSNTITDIKEQVNNGADIKDFIQVTGKGSTARNSMNQIINMETFEVNMSKKIAIDKSIENAVENVLTQSGKIIADITISSKPNPAERKTNILLVDPEDIYISCKDGDSQLTAISMQQPFYGNDKKTSKNTDLIKAYKNGLSYNEFEKQNSISSKAFKNMCKMFNCNKPEEVYNYFSKPKKDRKHNEPLTISKEYNDVDGDEIISTLMQLQIGGNYWYVNSNGACVYLDDNLEKNRFHFISSGTGKMEPSLIRIHGTLKTNEGHINCDLVFRTSGTTTEYPYRLFLDMDKGAIKKLYL